MFDLTLLQSPHVFLFGISFTVVFFLLFALAQSKYGGNRRRARYGGTVVAIVPAAAAAVWLGFDSLAAGLAAATAVILIGGTIDEISTLSPASQLAAQGTAAAIAVASGWIIPFVTNPFGEGVIYVDWLRLGETFSLAAFLLTCLWLVFLMNSVNWLDGTDGLAGTIGLVAFITLATVSLLPSTQDSRTFALAVIGAGTILGFLIWNWAPARLYLGTSGAWFLGLYLGLVAIVGGGKIATTLLVLALPAIDTVSVVVQRLASRQAPWRGDRIRHLHFRLRAAGISDRGIALLGGVVTAVCGAGAVLLQTADKLLLLVVGTSIGLLAAVFWWRQRAAPGITKHP